MAFKNLINRQVEDKWSKQINYGKTEQFFGFGCYQLTDVVYCLKRKSTDEWLAHIT